MDSCVVDTLVLCVFIPFCFDVNDIPPPVSALSLCCVTFIHPCLFGAVRLNTYVAFMVLPQPAHLGES